MPWECVCLTVPRTVEEERSAYQIASRKAGIWADAEVIDREASEFVAREESPEPVQEKDMWACPRCKCLNSRHELLCQVKVDEPLSGTEHVGTEPVGWILPNWTHELLSLLLEFRAFQTRLLRTTGTGPRVADRWLVLWSLPQPQLQEQNLLQLVTVREQPVDLPGVRELQLPKAGVLQQKHVWCS